MEFYEKYRIFLTSFSNKINKSHLPIRLTQGLLLGKVEITGNLNKGPRTLG